VRLSLQVGHRLAQHLPGVAGDASSPFRRIPVRDGKRRRSATRRPTATHCIGPAARDLHWIDRPVANAASGRGRKNRHGRAIRDAKRELREVIHIEQSEAPPPGDTPQGT